MKSKWYLSVILCLHLIDVSREMYAERQKTIRERQRACLETAGRTCEMLEAGR